MNGDDAAFLCRPSKASHELSAVQLFDSLTDEGREVLYCYFAELLLETLTQAAAAPTQETAPRALTGGAEGSPNDDQRNSG